VHLPVLGEQQYKSKNQQQFNDQNELEIGVFSEIINQKLKCKHFNINLKTTKRFDRTRSSSVMSYNIQINF